MIKVYTNSSSFHNVSKIEVVDGYGEGVRKVVIHQVVETDRKDRLHGGSLIVKHEITIHPMRNVEVDVTPIVAEVA